MQIWDDVRILTYHRVTFQYVCALKLNWPEYYWNTHLGGITSLNIISYTCLLESMLKLNFCWKVQSLINFKSLLSSLADVLTSWAAENKEVSSANKLHSLLRPFGKSLTYVKNKRSPTMEPRGTPALISNQDEHWPFKTILCFLLVKKSLSILIKSPHISFWCGM